MITLKLDQFTYDKASRTLSAEVSDFNGTGLDLSEFMVLSPKTGKHCLFRRPTPVRDREGEVTHWEYYSPAERVTLILWND